MTNSKIQLVDPITALVVEPALPAPASSRRGKHSIEEIDLIARRAHSISEQRTGDAGDNAESDWLEAEREIDTATKGCLR
jgi:hypothetical protein